MERETTPGARPMTRTIIVAVLAGLAVLVLLFPVHGIDPVPPVCYSVLGYVVPCEAWVSWVAAAATAGLVGFALWRRDRRP